MANKKRRSGIRIRQPLRRPAEAVEGEAWTPDRASRLADDCLKLAKDVEASKHDAAQGAVAPFAWFLVGEDGKPAFSPYFKESDADAMIAEFANARRPEDRETFTKHPLYIHPTPDTTTAELLEAADRWEAWTGTKHDRFDDGYELACKQHAHTLRTIAGEIKESGT